jgi:hypothetical protein
MGIMKAIYDIKPDAIASVSGDSDFAPLAIELREMGAYVETAAFRNAMSRLLAQRAGGCICLDGYYSEFYSPEPRMDNLDESAAARIFETQKSAEDMAETGIDPRISVSKRGNSSAAGIMELALEETPVNLPGAE